MRFWIKCNDRIEFKYHDVIDKEICERCLNEVIKGKCFKSRYAVRNTKNEAEYIYCHDKNIVGKHAKHISKITTDAFFTISKAARERNRDLTKIQTIAYHNAKKMNAAIGQKIDKIIDDDDFEKSGNEVKVIEKNIISSPEFVAREMLNIKKTVEQIESEYNLIEVLDLSEPFSDNDLTIVRVHKLLVLIFYLYKDEFFNKKIYVDIQDTHLSVKVDYGVAKSAVGQIFNNAIKYCKSDSNISITAKDKDGYIEIEFTMTSLYFNDDEIENLTKLGVRGKLTEDIKGEGVGLFAVENFMRMHKGYYQMKSNTQTKFNSGNKVYSENSFILAFYKYE